MSLRPQNVARIWKTRWVSLVRAHAVGHGGRYAIVTYCQTAQPTSLRATRTDASKHARLLIVLRSFNSVSVDALFHCEIRRQDVSVGSPPIKYSEFG